MTDQHTEFLNRFKLCDHRARCYVQGSAFHEKMGCIQPITGGWSVHFRSHPRVLEAEAEGWGRDLRAAIVAECKARLVRGEDAGEPDVLMPTRKEWWEGARANAERYRAGEEYRERVLGPVDAEPKRALPRVDREAWNARRGRKSARPLKEAAGAAISDLSRRMTGETNSGG